MSSPASSLVGALLLATTAIACGGTSPKAPAERPVPGPSVPDPLTLDVETFATLSVAPGNITLTPEGRIILSLHQFYAPEHPVAELVDGELVPFPEPAAFAASGTAPLDAVLGIQADAGGVVWMLDNAMRRGGSRRLVGWDTRADRLARVIDLGPPLTPADAFLNDLAIDRTNDAIYIADPAGGANAALLVIDLASGKVRRVLEGDRSVTPEDRPLVMDGKVVSLPGPDGAPVPARVGVNPIALDHDDTWLTFGPMHADRFYRVRTATLRDASLAPTELARRVEVGEQRPITDGISIDRDGNIYLGDLAANGIGVLRPGGDYALAASGPALSWVDAFSFAPDGYVYAVANQLHRSAPLNGGVNASQPPYRVLRFRPLAPGRVGR